MRKVNQIKGITAFLTCVFIQLKQIESQKQTLRVVQSPNIQLYNTSRFKNTKGKMQKLILSKIVQKTSQTSQINGQMKQKTKSKVKILRHQSDTINENQPIIIDNEESQYYRQEEFLQEEEDKAMSNNNESAIPVKKSQVRSIQQRTQNFISQFLDYEVYKQKNLNPQFLRIKNNILLIILILSSCGIYYLFENFIDVMLLAFIGGVGYQQMRERFVKFWTSDEPFFQKEMTMTVRILSIFGYVLLILTLPWVRAEFGYPQEFGKHLVLSDIIYAFSFKANLVVFCVQAFLLLKVLHLILAPKIFPIIAPRIPKSMGFYKWSFGIIFTVISLGAIIIIPSALALEVSHGGYRLQTKVQQLLKCRLINYENHNTSTLPTCSEIFFKNNTIIEQTLKQFKAQTSQVEDCMTYVSQMQKRLIGYEFLKYEEIVCTAYLIGIKASTYLTPNTDVLATGTTFLKTIFGNIAFLIMGLSNIVFSLTSFVTIFYITVSYFDPRSTVMQEIFFGERKELLGQITNLIQATLFIVVEHFLLSLILLELFNFSNFNMVISTLLSSMAFVPFFRPWIGAFFFCIIRSLAIGNHLVNIMFVVFYYLLSERIFSFRLKQMQLHEIIMNLSILFGIYQFGIAGIFYGPIIIILFRSVHRQLFRNQVYSNQQTNESGNSTLTERK